jgi:hypothetical protein
MIIDSMTFLSKEEVETLIEKSPQGKNTKFLNSAHSLWFRFKNYEKEPPMALVVDEEVVSLLFATYNRDKYTNLYEIVTVQGKEGNGYASKLWEYYVDYAVNKRRMERLKISCTPSSIGWHYRNGLVFWGVDPTGSLRSDQPLYSNRESQLEFRKKAIDSPSLAIPPNSKVVDFLKSQSVYDQGFGVKKVSICEEAIKYVGAAWLRNHLFTEESSLERFMI